MWQGKDRGEDFGAFRPNGEDDLYGEGTASLYLQEMLHAEPVRAEKFTGLIVGTAEPPSVPGVCSFCLFPGPVVLPPWLKLTWDSHQIKVKQIKSFEEALGYLSVFTTEQLADRTFTDTQFIRQALLSPSFPHQGAPHHLPYTGIAVHVGSLAKAKTAH
ncbi:hypothetical protein GCM10017783_22510 [Deinococcus piscis]|uniref:Uncharacterized protein n=1 Tax=Deinococcus piscis TaxID=394230 RepID=A0ABQ3KAJ4_9DEIO|nr:hypothetical protein GCM10017783_22510 [Deinococcus piscis]